LRAAPHAAGAGPVDLADISSEEDRLYTQLREQRYESTALSAFAAFGLLLAAMGIYGLVSYAVAQRQREIGVRIALGAGGRSIVALVSRRGLLLAAAGVAGGIGGSFALTRVLRSLLFGTSATDPAVFVRSGLVLIVIVLAASLIPARRATKVDPIIVLRAE
jgi:ABC-type antimicrobial peptide transport system permease subunit